MTYVIAGAGPAGVIAAETLRKTNPDSEIMLIGDEPEPPYSRMAIPYFMAGNIKEAGTHLRKSNNHYDDRKIKYVQDRVESVKPQDGKLTLQGGEKQAFDQLVDRAPDGETEVVKQVAARCASTKTCHTDNITIKTHPFSPVVNMSGLHRNPSARCRG